MPRKRTPRRNPKPIAAPRRFGTKYNTDMRKHFLDPFLSTVTSRLALAQSAAQALQIIDSNISVFLARPVGGVPVDVIQAHLDGYESYHRRELIKTFKTALGVNVIPMLSEPEIARFITARIDDNVSLIKTIPKRFHTKLKGRVGDAFKDAPFDEQKLRGIVRNEFGSAGYNLRRITTDQLGKLNGQLTAKRHGQLGIKEFMWLSSGDERVRPDHAIRDGVIYKYSEADLLPGEDILCRCVAQARIVKDAKVLAA